MRHLQKISIILLFVCSTVKSFTIPESSIAENWRQLNQLLNDRTISASWVDKNGDSIVYLQLKYGGERRSIAYLKSLQTIDDGNFKKIFEYAIFSNSQEMVHALLEKSEPTRFNKFESYGEFLKLAIEYDRLEIMRILIANNADIEYKFDELVNTQEHKPSRVPITGDWQELDLFQYAIKLGKVNAMHVLLDAGFDMKKYFNIKSQGNLIFYALESKSPYIVEFLLKNGFKSNVNNAQGNTPITFIIKNNLGVEFLNLMKAYGSEELKPKRKLSTSTSKSN